MIEDIIFRDPKKLDRMIVALESFEEVIFEAVKDYNEDFTRAVKATARRHRKTGHLERGIENVGVGMRDGDVFGLVRIRAPVDARRLPTIGGRRRLLERLSLAERRYRVKDYASLVNSRTGFFNRANKIAGRKFFRRLDRAWEEHFSGLE